MFAFEIRLLQSYVMSYCTLRSMSLSFITKNIYLSTNIQLQISQFQSWDSQGFNFSNNLIITSVEKIIMVLLNIISFLHLQLYLLISMYEIFIEQNAYQVINVYYLKNILHNQNVDCRA